MPLSLLGMASEGQEERLKSGLRVEGRDDFIQSQKSSRRRRDRPASAGSEYVKVTSDKSIIFTVGISGIFNLTKKTWNIYTNNPKTHQPVVVLPLVFK